MNSIEQDRSLAFHDCHLGITPNYSLNELSELHAEVHWGVLDRVA